MQILGEHESSVKKMLDEFGVYLKPSTFGKDVKPFLKDACSQIFGSATGLVDMMIAHVPSSKAGNANKVRITADFLCTLCSLFPQVALGCLQASTTAMYKGSYSVMFKGSSQELW